MGGASKLLLAACLMTCSLAVGLLTGPAHAGTSTFHGKNLDRPIPDEGMARVKVYIGGSGQIDQIEAAVRLKHRKTQQLKLSLRGPDGQAVVLSDGDAHGANLGEGAFRNCSDSQTVFSDSATIAIEDGEAPYAGSFRPAEPLTEFSGDDFPGFYTLTVRDLKAGARGRLFCFGIQLDPG